MNKIGFKKFDVADYLTDSESISEYLNDMFVNGSVEEFLSALNDVARAKGIKDIAKTTGLNRESLYKSLNSDTKVRFNTIVNILNALDIKIQFISKKTA